MSAWRNIAGPIISQVLKQTEHSTPAERRQALRDAYPFGERRYHPYKIWLNEIALQTGRIQPKRQLHLAHQPDPNQMTFSEVYGDIVIK